MQQALGVGNLGATEGDSGGISYGAKGKKEEKGNRFVSKRKRVP